MKLVNALSLIVLGMLLSAAYGLKSDLIEVTPGKHKVTVVAGDENARQWLADMGKN